MKRGRNPGTGRAGKIHCSMEKGGFIFLVKARLALIKFVFSMLLMSSVVGWLLPQGSRWKREKGDPAAGSGSSQSQQSFLGMGKGQVGGKSIGNAFFSWEI